MYTALELKGLRASAKRLPKDRTARKMALDHIRWLRKRAKEEADKDPLSTLSNFFECAAFGEWSMYKMLRSQGAFK